MGRDVNEENHEYTWVDENICACNDCGAHASSEEGVVHHKTCKPGESKKWENFYNQ